MVGKIIEEGKAETGKIENQFNDAGSNPGVPYIGYAQGILLRKNLRRRTTLFYKPGRSLRLLLGPASWMP
jgi:hypothetical protein